jgi:Transglutaminase-like superfamily
MLGVRVGLRTMPFPRLRRFVDRLTRGRRADSDATAARAVRRAVDRASRTVPGSACLAQALTAELLLRRDGCEARLIIGVAVSGTATERLSLDAHAWLESGGVVVTGEVEQLGTYSTLAVFETSVDGEIH